MYYQWVLVYAYSSQFDFFFKCYTVVNCYMLTYLFHNPLQCNQLHKCNHNCLHHLHRYHHFDMDCWHIHRYLSIKHTLSWILFYAYSSQFDFKKCNTVVNYYMLAYLFHNPLQCNQLHKCNHICLHHLHRYHHFDMDCWHIHQYLSIKQHNREYCFMLIQVNWF